MSIANARQFILTVLSDKSLYDQVNSASSAASLHNLLAKKGLAFNYEDFDQAYFGVLTDCATHEQAALIKEIRLWWDCLGQALSDPNLTKTDPDRTC